MIDGGHQHRVETAPPPEPEDPYAARRGFSTLLRLSGWIVVMVGIWISGESVSFKLVMTGFFLISTGLMIWPMQKPRGKR